MINDAESLLAFWFMEVGADRWFALDPALDDRIRSECIDLHKQAVGGELRRWEDTPEGVLGLLLLLDFLPRRMFRDTANAYATDDIAVELARMAIIKHFDDRIDRNFKLFFYLPFSHSEHLSDQRLAVFYIRERTKDSSWVQSAEWRLEVIRQFGRFPHRNLALGRETTPEEATFLAANPLKPLFQHRPLLQKNNTTTPINRHTENAFGIRGDCRGRRLCGRTANRFLSDDNTSHVGRTLCFKDV